MQRNVFNIILCLENGPLTFSLFLQTEKCRRRWRTRWPGWWGSWEDMVTILFSGENSRTSDEAPPGMVHYRDAKATNAGTLFSFFLIPVTFWTHLRRSLSSEMANVWLVDNNTFRTRILYRVSELFSLPRRARRYRVLFIVREHRAVFKSFRIIGSTT